MASSELANVVVQSSILFHVPHSSTRFPSREGCIRLDLIPGEVEKLTDWYTDKIFTVPGTETLRADFSRVFCDVERFWPDEAEPMSARGMGFYYTHTDDGQHFRDDGGFKALVKEHYYDAHQLRLAGLVDSRLESTGQCCIIDGHSFADAPCLREECQDPNRPDICIGTDPFHTPDWLAAAVMQVYRSAGYDVRVNWPFSGAMVPTAHYRKDNRVLSVMVEINRRLYLRQGAAIPGSLARLRALAEQVVAAITGSVMDGSQVSPR